ncbi:hypothetical protein J3T78_05860 [Staphylococcus nepalensis]|uniref:hypothetical protein n=1 Tax=Staphylococcus nepalensis TaxID=214473 RepID=UPI001A99AFEF|nr:hypothetical protein [Staphylococcus nepalensis]MBO1217504.1 hypothetical protein [Staphylococcus nepalensis]MBO1237238.1 hypothetical protein [Staphylococcus nepalensis]
MFSKEKKANRQSDEEEDYKQLKRRSDLASKLDPEVTRLNLGKERQKDKQQIRKLRDENEKLKEEKQTLSSENQKLKQKREKEQEEYHLKQIMFKH